MEMAKRSEYVVFSWYIFVFIQDTNGIYRSHAFLFSRPAFSHNTFIEVLSFAPQSSKRYHNNITGLNTVIHKRNN